MQLGSHRSSPTVYIRPKGGTDGLLFYVWGLALLLCMASEAIVPEPKPYPCLLLLRMYMLVVLELHYCIDITWVQGFCICLLLRDCCCCPGKRILDLKITGCPKPLMWCATEIKVVHHGRPLYFLFWCQHGYQARAASRRHQELQFRVNIFFRWERGKVFKNWVLK